MSPSQGAWFEVLCWTRRRILLPGRISALVRAGKRCLYLPTLMRFYGAVSSGRGRVSVDGGWLYRLRWAVPAVVAAAAAVVDCAGGDARRCYRRGWCMLPRARRVRCRRSAAWVVVGDKERNGSPGRGIRAAWSG